MAYANGRIPKSKLKALPKSWSNAGRQEYLRADAAASLSRALSRAVATSGENFQLYDAYRSYEEQVSILKDYYYPVSGGRRSGDRVLNGVTYRKRSGKPAAASPGHSNHGTGLAIDIHHGAIQGWLKSEGRTYGWTWTEGKKLGESWHFVYNPALDQMKSEGYLDHAAIQKVVGATPDGKIGTGTVAKIKAWQKAHGLTPDGKVGAKTKAAMLGEAIDIVEDIADAITDTPATAVSSYKLDQQKSPNCYGDRKGHEINSITVHWWGNPVGQKRDGIISWLVNPKAQVSAHYVVTKGHVTQLVEESCGSWANGNKTANLESITIECDPNDPEGTAPTVAALISDIRGRHGDLPIYPHQHWVATECPGAYVDLLPAIDAMAEGREASLGAPATKPVKKANLTVDGRLGTNTAKALQRYLNKYHGAKLKVDGKIGKSTWKAFQRAVGAPYIDGIISRQSYKASELGNGITQGWEYTGRGSSGSQTIEKMQSWVGAKQDGVLGEGTIKKLQRKLNTYELG